MEIWKCGNRNGNVRCKRPYERPVSSFAYFNGELVGCCCCCAVVLLCCCADVLINSRRIKNDGNNEIGDALWSRPCCVIGRHFWPEKEVATPQHFSSPAYANQCRMKSFVNFTFYFYLYFLLHLFDESHLHNEMPLGCWKWQGFFPIIHQFFCWNVILVPLVGWMMQICKFLARYFIEFFVFWQRCIGKPRWNVWKWLNLCSISQSNATRLSSNVNSTKHSINDNYILSKIIIYNLTSNRLTFSITYHFWECWKNIKSILRQC